MMHRQFAERLNKELDLIGLPQKDKERVEAFSKLMKTPRFKADSILHGELMPSQDLLLAIAKELEVSIDWLTGKDSH